jgi:hypothetical protein
MMDNTMDKLEPVARSSMKTIILHIGYPKTGTSSLQWFLHKHRNAVRRQGVYYPLTGQAADHAHHGLAFSLGANAQEGSSRDQVTQLFASLATEIDQCGADTVVLSSEVFLANLERLRGSQELAAILDGRARRIICFVRRQKTFLESLYYQSIWDPNVRFAKGPDAFIEEFPYAGDYHGPLSMWAEWAGRENISTVVYEQAQREDGCIKRFCQLAGIDTTRLRGANFDLRRQVSTVPAVATMMMRTGNGYTNLSTIERETFAKHVRAFTRATGSLHLSRTLFTDDEVARIEARYLESNHRLAKDFVRQPLDGAWFRVPAGS